MKLAPWEEFPHCVTEGCTRRSFARNPYSRMWRCHTHLSGRMRRIAEEQRDKWRAWYTEIAA